MEGGEKPEYASPSFLTLASISGSGCVSCMVPAFHTQPYSGWPQLPLSSPSSKSPVKASPLSVPPALEVLAASCYY